MPLRSLRSTTNSNHKLPDHPLLKIAAKMRAI
jgi:hypothetical protein